MKKYRKYIVIAVSIAALVWIKLQFFPSPKSKGGGGKAAQNKVPAVPVSVFVTGASGLKDKLFASGSIVANEEADLKAEASGRIVYLNLPEGQPVAAGTLVLKVDDSDLRAQLDKIRTQIKLASVAESRQHKLLQLEGTSHQEYDNSLANLQSARADSAFCQTQIAKTQVRAPFAGVIGIRTVSPGSYITPAVTVARIQQINPIKIDFTLPEKYSTLLKAGDPITFRCEGIASTFHGKVLVKDPQVDLASRSIRFRAVSTNPKGVLLPGAFARVEIALKETGKSLFVPTEAIVPVLKGKKLFVVKNGVAEEKLVETGLRTEEFIQIVSDNLKQGDSVVVNGNFQLKQGSAVKVAGKKKPAVASSAQ